MSFLFGWFEFTLFSLSLRIYFLVFILHECLQVLLTTPTTPTERMERITKASEGFVYLVSVKNLLTIFFYNLFSYSVFSFRKKQTGFMSL
jgi:hypothetical protein